MAYHRSPDRNLKRPLKEPGPVLAFGKPPVELVFCCPCGGREVYVTSPPHEIEFDQDEKLTLNGSVGSRAVEGPHDFRLVHGEVLHDLPASWCHFFVKNGEVEMCGDAQCPGGSGA